LFSTEINDSTARKFADSIVQGLEGLVIYHGKTRVFKPLVLLASNWNWTAGSMTWNALESTVEALTKGGLIARQHQLELSVARFESRFESTVDNVFNDSITR